MGNLLQRSNMFVASHKADKGAPAGRNVGTKQNTETIFRPAGALKTNNHLFLQTVSPSGATLPLN